MNGMRYRFRMQLGGFIPLELPSSNDKHNNILSHWVGSDTALLTSSSRSALSHLVRCFRNQRLWLPAYSCTSIAPDLDVSYFPLDIKSLTPDIDFLESNIRDGDIVLVIDYFGAPPNANFLAFVECHDSIIWIQDCAQAIDSGKKWGHFRLYSPRKLFGVSDGGVLVAGAENDIWSLLPKLQSVSTYLPGLIPRVLRNLELQLSLELNAYEEYQISEKAITLDQNAMSDLTRSQLGGISIADVGVARRKNYDKLHEHLATHSMLPNKETSWVPFGYPIVSRMRDRLKERLETRGIFAASHWKTLPVPKSDFPNEHRLALQQLTLPCDQRYTEGQMEWLASEVLGALAGLNPH